MRGFEAMVGYAIKQGSNSTSASLYTDHKQRPMILPEERKEAKLAEGRPAEVQIKGRGVTQPGRRSQRVARPGGKIKTGLDEAACKRKRPAQIVTSVVPETWGGAGELENLLATFSLTAKAYG